MAEFVSKRDRAMAKLRARVGERGAGPWQFFYNGKATEVIDHPPAYIYTDHTAAQAERGESIERHHGKSGKRGTILESKGVKQVAKQGFRQLLLKDLDHEFQGLLYRKGVKVSIAEEDLANKMRCLAFFTEVVDKKEIEGKDPAVRRAPRLDLEVVKQSAQRKEESDEAKAKFAPASEAQAG